MNVEWLSRLPGPCRAGLYFGLQRAIGAKVGRRWRQWQQWRQLTPVDLDRQTERDLAKLLDHARRHCAYYRELGLEPQPGERSPELLSRFPILSRENVRTHFTALVAERWRREILSPESVPKKRHGWLVVKTGGSTGTPTAVVHDGLFREWGRASRLFSQALCGFPLGTRYFRLWGSELELFQQEETLERRVLRALFGEVPLNAFRSREAELMNHYRVLQSRPDIRHLMAYFDAAVLLAGFIQEQRLPRRPLQTIMACAGTVTPEGRALLEETFQAEVFDKYGSRECADLACECAEHHGLHVFSPHVFLEVVDAQGHPCPPGESGRLLVTPLRNFAFPLIRYEIGDLGAWADPGDCPCGLPFPRLSGLQGRQDDRLLTEDGAWVSPLFIRHFVGVSLNRHLIREWQLEQIAVNRFVFSFVPLRTERLAENLDELKAAFQKALGISAQIEMRPVLEIAPARSGKTLWVINRMNRDLKPSSACSPPR